MDVIHLCVHILYVVSWYLMTTQFKTYPENIFRKTHISINITHETI